MTNEEYKKLQEAGRKEVEDRARAIGESRVLLLRRLKEARLVLNTPGREGFQKLIFDFANKRLISDDGTLALQLLVRRFPNEPVGYENQQTSTGVVILAAIKGP